MNVLDFQGHQQGALVLAQQEWVHHATPEGQELCKNFSAKMFKLLSMCLF